MKKNLYANKLFPIILSLSCLFILSYCNSNKTKVKGGILTETTTSETTTTTTTAAKKKPPKYFYGNYFQVQNTSLYEDLLKSCRRCGTKRFIDQPGGGGTIYQRHYVHSSDSKKCSNWLNSGYIEIEFSARRLPTDAIVSIQPKYTGVDTLAPQWGEPFSVKSKANPINDNKGFQIIITPAQGLKGIHSLSFESSYTNHVNNAKLDLSIVYGQTDSQIILSQELDRLTEKVVKKAFFTCDTYTN